MAAPNSKAHRGTTCDVVEVFNDHGSTDAMAYPLPSIKRHQTFMLFGYVEG